MNQKRLRKSPRKSLQSKRKIRFAVVGLGYISQTAVLPAFEHASKNCSLDALISGDPEKLEQLGKKYGVKNLFSYEEYEECLESGMIDAVYIALPNSQHKAATIKAAERGVHVLCEKPMAITSSDCLEMIRACEAHRIKLMIAYRLHFEEANLEVLDIVRSGKIGDLVLFNSTFSMQVAENNIRTESRLGGGSLYDIGIYCINSARTLFECEPRYVVGVVSNPRDSRFHDVDGLTGGILEFGPGRIANFISSFSSSDCSTYEIVGTKGSLRLNNAYEFHEGMSYELTIDGKTRYKNFQRHDQFAPELMRFADNILRNTEPSASGYEGLADVRIIEALHHSSDIEELVYLPKLEKKEYPDKSDHISAPPVRKQKLIYAQTPSK